MQNWSELYTELCAVIADNVPGVKWLDLWHNQVSFLEEELPFPTPAVFFNFRIMETEDAGERVQRVRLQVDAYVFYETFANTYHGSANKGDALSFLNLLNDVYACLHGSSGTSWSEMRRIGMNPVDTGSAGNLYQITFECWLMDYAARRQWEEGTGDEVDIEHGAGPQAEAVPDNGFQDFYIG